MAVTAKFRDWDNGKNEVTVESMSTPGVYLQIRDTTREDGEDAAVTLSSLHALALAHALIAASNSVDDKEWL